MYGLIFAILEEWIITSTSDGLDLWHTIKAQAGCHVPDRGFLRRSYYPDSDLIQIVVAASNVLGLLVPEILKAFGGAFGAYVMKYHYGMVRCQGSTFRQWFSNLNAMHDHIQKSFPASSSSSAASGKDCGQFTAPVFWCEDDDDLPGSVLLHYFSQRGTLLVPFVEGIIATLAVENFQVPVTMHQLALQTDEAMLPNADGSSTPFTTWRITAVDPEQAFMVSPIIVKLDEEKEKEDHPQQQQLPQREKRPFHTTTSTTTKVRMSMTCPFSGMLFQTTPSPPTPPTPTPTNITTLPAHNGDDENDAEKLLGDLKKPLDKSEEDDDSDSSSSSDGDSSATSSSSSDEDDDDKVTDLLLGELYEERTDSPTTADNRDLPRMIHPTPPTTPKATTNDLPSSSSSEDTNGMSLSMMREIFPFHILVRRDFTIVQVGETLPRLLERQMQDFSGKHIQEFLNITRPVMGNSWDWKALHKLADQHFFLSPAIHHHHHHTTPNVSMSLNQRVSMIDSRIRFKGAMIDVCNGLVMFVLMPDAHDVDGLQNMGLTMSDLPLVTSQRDNVFLGEYIAQEAKAAHSLDKLSKRLDNEKNLSNTLLSKMLPKQVVEDLRAGKTVEPKLYENVTLFFSDIEGFTTICEKVDPWDVIDMLNQLYGVMDHLATHFNLYKVETIGDAYMCCSGLPVPDEYHAENIANFALAVVECVKHIKSPVDHVTPLRLRIGIHSGSCTAGVVGTLTPHYCLFGDMVNTTARHESTGMAGKVHVSSILFGRLKHFSPHGEDKTQYTFTPRGLVEMKGKGQCYTYWLESGTKHNHAAGSRQLQVLSNEIVTLLKSNTFTRRSYFRRTGEIRLANSSEVDTVSSYTTKTDGSASFGSLGSFGGLEVDRRTRADDKVGDSRVRQRKSMSAVKMRLSLKVSDGHSDPIDGVFSSHASSLAMSVEDKATNLDEIIAEQEKVQGRPQTLDSLDLEDPSKVRPRGDAESLSDNWSDLGKEMQLPTEDLVKKSHGMLSTLLKECLLQGGNAPKNLELITSQLYGFVHRISTLYPTENRFHTFRHAFFISQTADYLWRKSKQYHDNSGNGLVGIDWNPWNRFILVFSSLVHSVKHHGKSNEQLERENHLTYQMHGNGRKSCQQRQAAHCALGTLADEFPELYEEIMFTCPIKFHHVVRKLILASDLESREISNKRSKTFERVMANKSDSSECSKRAIAERTEVVMEQIMSMSTLGHYAQDQGVFLEWSRAEFQESLVSQGAPRKAKQRETWHDDRILYFKQVVVPMVDQMEEIIAPSYCNLKAFVEHNLKYWQEEATFKVTYIPMTKTTTENSFETKSKRSLSDTALLGQTSVYDKKLVDLAVGLLLKVLKRVMASHRGEESGTKELTSSSDGYDEATTATTTITTTPFEEVRSMIPIKPIKRRISPVELPPGTKEELEDYVVKIASGYNCKLEFNNFEHATTVASLVHLLFKRIQKASARQDADNGMLDFSFGISFDPLVHLALVFAALIQDLGHTGVCNDQLTKENPNMAQWYSNKSIAKQRSIDVAWDLLADSRYHNLQKCIFGYPGEQHRFRQLVVNCVMATDLLDNDLEALRHSRWEAFFGRNSSSPPPSSSSLYHQDNMNNPHNNASFCQATSIMEHVIQAASIAHTMQQWPVYVSWNERQFDEAFAAFAAGRGGRDNNDPYDSWYHRELWFFDHKVIPLASKLQQCGVFGPLGGDEFCIYAQKNREKWANEGEKLSRKMVRRARRRYLDRISIEPES
jgi:class 3 adenylate cyclase